MEAVVAVLLETPFQVAAILIQAVVLGVLAIWLRDTSRKLDHHLTECHKRQELALESLRHDLTEARKEARESRGKLYEEVRVLGQSIARLEGKYDGGDKR